eukprot:scaffold362555_cov113-Cyclotella_meneghiniana.AAC.3
MHRHLSLIAAAAAIIFSSQYATAFSIPPPQATRPNKCSASSDHRATALNTSRRKWCTQLHESKRSSDQDKPTIDTTTALDTASITAPSCWNPTLRKQMAVISFLGMMETIYLTYDKLAPNNNDNSFVNSICSATGSSCNSVLSGPYASISILGVENIPLSLLGVGAYTTVFTLAILPLLFPTTSAIATIADGNGNESNNRIALLGITTLMGTFSVYLVSLIVGVLHSSCIFCFVSAGLSVTMAGMSWFGGMLPSLEEFKIDSNDGAKRESIVQLRKNGVITGASSFGIATIMALGLFLSVDDNTSSSSFATNSGGIINGGTLVASTESINYEKNIPPPITTKSSSQALNLASDLSSLNSKMYGAFWCSHCYDQKQALGYQAMQSIPYVECDREGYNNQRDLCKERGLPGYPTWEIGGELFPGERSLDELREIVDDVLSRKRGV